MTENKKIEANEIWHRNYYENIIRNEEAHIKIVEYMKNNPMKWYEDRYFE